ncbi:glycosyltransferase family 39 protein, partial [Patescibacteria group bacterium]|nr:glycosyltransferase family 39 protein [Patescibacteria group bacterium]
MEKFNFKVLRAKRVGSYILVFIILILMGTVMSLSMKDDTYMGDEMLFLSTGYMYLTEPTTSFGFEHPPLVRYLAALPLLGLNLKPASEFYDSTLAREPLLNLGGSFNQWNFAENFLFGQDESPEKILFLGRLMMVAITLLLGFLIFKWTSLKWGNKSGLLALALFCLSPLILAHGRIINMDVASALGIFASTYYFVRFLQKPSLKRTLIA